MRGILAFVLILIGLMTPVALAQQLYTHDKSTTVLSFPPRRGARFWSRTPRTNILSLFMAIDSTDI